MAFLASETAATSGVPAPDVLVRDAIRLAQRATDKWDALRQSGSLLEEIGAADVPQILVFNKCDLLEDSQQPRTGSDWLEVHAGLRRARVFVSARAGLGLDALRALIADRVNADQNAEPHPGVPDLRFAGAELALDDGLGGAVTTSTTD